jgi:hypothetical protein
MEVIWLHFMVLYSSITFTGHDTSKIVGELQDLL